MKEVWEWGVSVGMGDIRCGEGGKIDELKTKAPLLLPPPPPLPYQMTHPPYLILR